MEKRVIKFRAWDKETQKYVVGSQTIGNILYEVIHNPNTDVLQFYELEQFTGLHDRDGREIYEGDKVCIGRGTAEIAWCDGGFVFANQNEHWLDDWNFPDDSHRMKIVGHIHETN